MAYKQIRINKTKELTSALVVLKNQYPLLSEVDIIKMLISEKLQTSSTNLHKELLLKHASKIWEDLGDSPSYKLSK